MDHQEIERKWQARWEKAGLDFAKHAVVTTGVGSKLYNYAKERGFLEFFPMWDWVGGRTSEFAAVGLLPAALQGIDIRTMLKGAAEMDAATRVADMRKNPAAMLALMWYKCTSGKGLKDMVILPYKDRLRVLLGKLMPGELIPGFLKCNPSVDHKSLPKVLKDWRFDISGYVGYERCVITAGGVSQESIIAKTLESKSCKGLYFAGEILDLDGDTGGYNLQIAFSTGMLAGQSAARSLM